MWHPVISAMLCARTSMNGSSVHESCHAKSNVSHALRGVSVPTTLKRRPLRTMISASSMLLLSLFMLLLPMVLSCVPDLPVSPNAVGKPSSAFGMARSVQVGIPSACSSSSRLSHERVESSRIVARRRGSSESLSSVDASTILGAGRLDEYGLRIPFLSFGIVFTVFHSGRLPYASPPLDLRLERSGPPIDMNNIPDHASSAIAGRRGRRPSHRPDQNRNHRTERPCPIPKQERARPSIQADRLAYDTKHACSQDHAHTDEEQNPCPFPNEIRYMAESSTNDGSTAF